MKYIFLTINLIYYLNGCCFTSSERAFYEVTGTKTDIIINYKGRDIDKSQDKNLTTININRLPWNIFITVHSGRSVHSSGCNKSWDPWFLSAYSESEGEMTISINGYTNTTTNNYIEMSLPAGEWREGYRYTNKNN